LVSRALRRAGPHSQLLTAQGDISAGREQATLYCLEHSPGVVFWHGVDRHCPILDELRSSQRECPLLSVTRDVDGWVSRCAAAYQLDLPLAGLGVNA
jgi:hypothetical protein